MEIKEGKRVYVKLKGSNKRVIGHVQGYNKQTDQWLVRFKCDYTASGFSSGWFNEEKMEEVPNYSGMM